MYKPGFRAPRKPEAMESGMDRTMSECIDARDKLSKFKNRLDVTDKAVREQLGCFWVLGCATLFRLSSVELREVRKMDEAISKIGVHYDSLAKLKAEFKVKGVSEQLPDIDVQFCLHGSVCLCACGHVHIDILHC